MWLSDCCLTSTQQLEALSWREQVTFQWDDNEVRFVLYQHWNNSPRIDMSPHWVALSCFRANQYLLFLLIAVCLARSNKYQFHSLWFDPIGPRTHDLPHSRWARYLSYRRCGSLFEYKHRQRHINCEYVSAYYLIPIYASNNISDSISWRLRLGTKKGGISI